ncbi:MAG: hypothetical protein GF329_06265 [Candidatus Lokiarchaeota archaeon]|nr:hypothetical protein [Candidatus Lokiarchaeota archaeon]
MINLTNNSTKRIGKKMSPPWKHKEKHKHKHWKHKRNRKIRGNRLTEVPSGKRYKVLSVGTQFGPKRRLCHLGVLPGVDIIKKRSAPMRGPIEVVVKGSSLVIGRGLASKILVRAKDE